MINTLLPLLCINFIWLQQVFPAYSTPWIAAYPVGNAIHPLNNWGQEDRGLPTQTLNDSVFLFAKASNHWLFPEFIRVFLETHSLGLYCIMKNSRFQDIEKRSENKTETLTKLEKILRDLYFFIDHWPTPIWEMLVIG